MTREAPELRSSLDLPPPLSRQDAGFLQRRVAQVVTHRRLMLFEADPAAPPPPPPPPPPPELPEDDVDYAEALPEAAGGDPTAAGGSRTRDGAEESGRTREGKADGEAEDDEDGSGCILEENPDGGGKARGRDVEDEEEGGCVLEENAGEESDGQGCMLEDNA